MGSSDPALLSADLVALDGCVRLVKCCSEVKQLAGNEREMDVFGLYEVWWRGLSRTEQADAFEALDNPVPRHLVNSLRSAGVQCLPSTVLDVGVRKLVWHMPTSLTTFVELQSLR